MLQAMPPELITGLRAAFDEGAELDTILDWVHKVWKSMAPSGLDEIKEMEPLERGCQHISKLPLTSVMHEGLIAGGHERISDVAYLHVLDLMDLPGFGPTVVMGLYNIMMAIGYQKPKYYDAVVKVKDSEDPRHALRVLISELKQAQ